MKNFTYILITLLLCCGWTADAGAQVLDPTARKVVATAGADRIGTSVMLSFTVGGLAVSTAQSEAYTLTQGFQQANFVMLDPPILELVATNESCFGAADGTTRVDFTSGYVTPPLTYLWDNGGVNPLVMDLSAGTHQVTVTGANGRSIVNSIEVGLDDDTPCELVFYSGITPNGDFNNDKWVIDNIHLRQPNSVRIFARSGVLVWSADNYDNQDKCWGGTNNRGQDLLNDTYFYVVEVGNKVYKGWIELTR